MGHYVYILQSERTGRYYVGVTADIEQRMCFHNEKGKGYTARYRPWRVVYLRAYGSKAEALAEENRIKGWKSRVMIERLIASGKEVL